MSGNYLDTEYPDRDTLAKLWKASTRTIANYESLPDGLPSLRLGGKARYPMKDAIAWLESRVTRPNPRRRA
jgi:hypothetical protein